MKGVNAAHEASKAMQKRIRNLENQLDKALVKFNEAQTHNKQLHLDIENLRLDRDREADIQQKLKSTLVLKTQQANRLFEEIHAAHK
jgi:chromosome segregation ATPase